MNQQLSAVVKYYQMFQLSVTVPNLCPQPKSSLINSLINDRLLDA